MKLNSLLSVYQMKLKQDNWAKFLNTSKEAETVGKLIELVNEEYSTSLNEFDFAADLQDDKKEEFQIINNQIVEILNNDI